MTGDTPDILGRLKAVLPTRWFPDASPVLESVLTGLSSGWAIVYGLVQYVQAQTRIASATGVWLDLIGLDFFGYMFVRMAGQSDDSFRFRIQTEMFRPRATRLAVSAALKDLTGRTPVIFEPALTSDTGGYGGILSNATGLGYCCAGGWGSLQLPFQCFVTAFRPNTSGIAFATGWGGSAGAYGVGSIEYGSLDMIEGQVTDSDIYAQVALVLPAATTAWVCITN